MNSSTRTAAFTCACLIGAGMHCALAAAFPGSIIARAFDISPAANDAYEFYFGTRPWQVGGMCIRKP